jgi:teichuronic acid biosynthesis glycosyltransferase TuaG
MYQPFISVIIPTFNSAKYISETIRSVQAQDWHELEIIIMDDGSSDNTLSLVRNLAKEDSRIKVYQQENGKPAKARNNAVRKAKGDWIAFLDSDDIWLPGKLRLQYQKTIEANVDLSFTDGYICLNNDMSLRHHRFGVTSTQYEGEKGMQAFQAQNRIPTSSVFMKKSVFYQYGFMPEYPEYPMYSEDYLFWVQLLDKGAKLLGINEALFLYRVHSESTIGEEIRLMPNLLNVLLLLPGERNAIWKNHLEKSFVKYIFLLNDSNAIHDLKPNIKPVCSALYGRFNALIASRLWSISPRLFLSYFWRIRLFKDQ